MIRFRILLIEVFLIGLGMVSSGRCGDTIDRLLDKVLYCPEVLCYQGIMNVQIGGGDSAYVVKNRIIYVAPDKSLITTLKPNNLKGNTFCTREGKVFFKKKDEELFVPAKDKFPSRGFTINKDNLMLLRKNYDITIIDNVEYLNRNAVILEIKSKYGPRPWLRNWIDERTGLVVKLEKYNYQDGLISKYWYKKLSLCPEINNKLFEVEVASESKTQVNYRVFKSPKDVKNEFGFTLTKVPYLPDGYILERLIGIERENAKIAHIILSDGLSTLSIFQKYEVENSGSFQHGAGEIDIIHTDTSTILKKWIGNYKVGLVGELPVEEMKKILYGIESYLGNLTMK